MQSTYKKTIHVKIMQNEMTLPSVIRIFSRFLQNFDNTMSE